MTSTAPSPPLTRATQQRRVRRFRIISTILLIAFAALAVDMIYIEPYRIEVTHYEITGNVKAPLKIAHLSDIHTHGINRREREMFEIVEREKPDMIVVTGDSPGEGPGNYADVREVYLRLHAPLGVWFVRGNWENDRLPHNEKAFYRDAGIRFLLNSNEAARPDVYMVGLDDPYTGVAKPDVALANIPKDAYTIALFHSPAFFDHMAGRVDLCLTGHTHGGQVRIPFVKPFWLPRGCGEYLAGWYNQKGTQMYVSRGIGTSVLPIRLLCRPEIDFITIEPETATP